MIQVKFVELRDIHFDIVYSALIATPNTYKYIFIHIHIYIIQYSEMKFLDLRRIYVFFSASSYISFDVFKSR